MHRQTPHPHHRPPLPHSPTEHHRSSPQRPMYQTPSSNWMPPQPPHSQTPRERPPTAHPTRSRHPYSHHPYTAMMPDAYTYIPTTSRMLHETRIASHPMAHAHTPMQIYMHPAVHPQQPWPPHTLPSPTSIPAIYATQSLPHPDTGRYGHPPQQMAIITYPECPYPPPMHMRPTRETQHGMWTRHYGLSPPLLPLPFPK